MKADIGFGRQHAAHGLADHGLIIHQQHLDRVPGQRGF